ncbi:uncharacterized protein FFUJ_14757 [Fusarium fujikuroi IMI 58289]|uniref:Uncharacterized protein n=1 Tax=Gibberella fujikuroi (strain CBS 195.34 / IMI 58289 / NRRL A-6831) TaxID=1279085 RepID=S0DYS6_GIBF5|nr:uncharacterized protein FFUJ_14757 [Fusarium fujikuroi IMI 58289]CCT67744.1 uncharacterized protein FFUJ_14757 [Fusarium fujikuroi IMI 58289]SCO22137.1 uncharacterized protein FFM5_12893 [Fusarium fujikuroi]SCO42350.1 uncharacterized protein FFMR_06763 [Fusarium fujikuroi]
MPALSVTDAAETIANSVLFSRAANEPGDALQVICAWPVSGQYGTGTRVLYYVLIAACLVARREEWLVNPCLAAALVLPAVAAIHGIVLTAMHNPDAVDMDIFGAFQLCAIGILAAPVTVMLSKTYFNDPGRNTIFLWTFLLLIGLLSMTIEFYRIETHSCLIDASGNSVSPNASKFHYVEGNNCNLTCSTQDGPSSPMRGGSANNIYVIPAPHTLTFGTATLLAAACCVHAVLCLVSMWDRVLEINWRRRFGKPTNDAASEDDESANKGVMKKVNDTIGFFLRILAIPVFGGAGLAILIVGEINFFSPQVNYQTEPMANIGQWAPITGTAMAMIGSLYLLLARHADQAGEPYPSHHCNCSHCHFNDETSQVSHQESISSLNSHHITLTVTNTDTRTNNQLSPHLNPTQPRTSISSSRLRDPSVFEEHSQTPRNPYRQKIENAFFRFGEMIGTPAHDFITEPKVKRPDRVDFPMIPGEQFRDLGVSAVEIERDQHQDGELSPVRSRPGSFIGSDTSVQGVGRSTSMPIPPPPLAVTRPRSSTGPRPRPASLYH